MTHYLIQVSRDNFENTATVNIRAHRGGDTSGNMLNLSPDNVTEFPSKQAAYKALEDLQLSGKLSDFPKIRILECKEV